MSRERAARVETSTPVGPGARAFPQVTRRKVLLGALSLPAALAIGSCDASHPPAMARLARPASSKKLNVLDFGATGDGHTDDTGALRKALAAMRPGASLTFPANKTFVHSAVLEVTTPNTTLLGPGTLSASAEATSALQLNADQVTVERLVLAMPHTTQRWSTPDQHKLVIGHSGCAVRDVQIVGSAAAGIFCFGASDFTIGGARVINTRADGIHMTYGSHNGSVDEPLIINSGDDGVAVVSYVADGRQCHSIRVMSPHVHTTSGGRGISVVGGQDVAYTNIDVRSSSAAGVYIASEGGGSPTNSVQNVTVSGGTVAGANTDAQIDHGAILVYAGRSGGEVTDVIVSGLAVSGTRATASRQIGVIVDGGGMVSNVIFRALRLAQSPTPYEGTAPRSDFSLQNVTAAGRTLTVPAAS